MRKSNLLFSAVMALTMGSLASCADDLTTDIQAQETVDHDQMRYLNVAIVSPTSVGTRATADNDFKQGSEAENFVKAMTFVFYDANGLPTGQAYDMTFTTNTTDNGFTTNTGGNVGKIWKSVVPVTLAQGENLPSYVMCFINPVGEDEFKTKSLKEIEAIERQKVVTDDGNFPMTNSVYYGTNPITGETNVRVFAAPVTTGQLYTSEDAALAADAKSIDIYVERYAARIELNMPATTGDGTSTIVPNATDVNGYTLTFVPEYWRPNAIDQNIFAVKRYGLIENGVPNYNPTYTGILTNFNNKTWWNEADKFRSYWACSPSYYTNSYPKVSDNITDVAEKNDYTGAEYPYDLHYFNYDQIAKSKVDGGVTFQKSIAWDATNGFNQVYYARETTTASSAWGWNNEETKGYNPLATLPSVVIVGHYTLEAAEGFAPVPADDKTFYLYGKTNGKYNLYFESNIMAAMVNQQSVVLAKTTAEGVDSYTAYRETTGFKVEHPSMDVRNVKNTTVAGRLVALQLDATALPDNLYYYDATQPDGQKYVLITENNLNTVNSNLLSAGYATKYGEGIGYFNIPVEHLGIYDGDDYVAGAKETANGNKYDFTKCPAGSFGIVRNHAYSINVSKISGLATALRDEYQPIVPPVDDINYYISARLNILNWRIVPTQNVEL